MLPNAPGQAERRAHDYLHHGTTSLFAALDTRIGRVLSQLQHRLNFADTTVRTYLHGVAHFSLYFRRPPDQLGPEDIRKYQAMPFPKLKYSPNTVIPRLAVARFFYIHVLKRGWRTAERPYPKKVRHLPGVLSQEEVARLIDAADTPFHRILLMTMYAIGAHRAEAACRERFEVGWTQYPEPVTSFVAGG